MPRIQLRHTNRKLRNLFEWNVSHRSGAAPSVARRLAATLVAALHCLHAAESTDID